MTDIWLLYAHWLGIPSVSVILILKPIGRFPQYLTSQFNLMKYTVPSHVCIYNPSHNLTGIDKYKKIYFDGRLRGWGKKRINWVPTFPTVFSKVLALIKINYFYRLHLVKSSQNSPNSAFIYYTFALRITSTRDEKLKRKRAMLLITNGFHESNDHGTRALNFVNVRKFIHDE